MSYSPESLFACYTCAARMVGDPQCEILTLPHRSGVCEICEVPGERLVVREFVTRFTAGEPIIHESMGRYEKALTQLRAIQRGRTPGAESIIDAETGKSVAEMTPEELEDFVIGTFASGAAELLYSNKIYEPLTKIGQCPSKK